MNASERKEPLIHRIFPHVARPFFPTLRHFLDSYSPFSSRTLYTVCSFLKEPLDRKMFQKYFSFISREVRLPEKLSSREVWGGGGRSIVGEIGKAITHTLAKWRRTNNGWRTNNRFINCTTFTRRVFLTTLTRSAFSLLKKYVKNVNRNRRRIYSTAIVG